MFCVQQKNSWPFGTIWYYSHIAYPAFKGQEFKGIEPLWVVNRGIGCVQWCTVVYIGVQWCILVYSGVYWCTVVNSGVQWCILVHSGEHGWTVAYSGLQLCRVVFSGEQLCTVVYSALLYSAVVLHNTVCDYVSYSSLQNTGLHFTGVRVLCKLWTLQLLWPL